MNARNKGARGERELAAELAKIVGSARRTGLMQSQQDAPESDVEWLDALVVESKRCQRVEIDRWAQQNERKASKLDKLSVVCWRRNREPWRIAMRLEDLPAISRAIVEALDEKPQDRGSQGTCCKSSGSTHKCRCH